MVLDLKDKSQYTVLTDKSQITENHGPRIGIRHVQALLLFLIIFHNYILRVSMSVIVVAMADPNASNNKDIPTYDWSDKNLVLTAFMWGYIIPQIGAGYIATMFGAKWLLVGSLFISSLSGFLIPFVAKSLGSQGVMVIRLLQGLSQGVLFPCVHSILGKWVPLQERSRLGTLPYLGISIGNICAMLFTGVISSSWYGWPMALYLYGSSGLIVTAIASYVCASEPDVHPTITKEEKYYIKNNLSEKTSQNQEVAAVPVPWKEILLSLPFWGLIFAQVGGSFTAWMLLFETPIYMRYVLKFDLKSNSLLSSLSYIFDTCGAAVFSVLADYLIVKKICTVNATRKIINSWGMILTAVLIFLLTQCNSDHPYRAVIYIALIGFVNGSMRSGYNVNHIDLSPRFAGVLMGIANCLCALAGSAGPYLVYILVKNEDDPDQWKMIFYVSAAVALVCLFFNLSFGSGSVQKWNDGSKKFRANWQQLPVKA